MDIILADYYRKGGKHMKLRFAVHTTSFTKSNLYDITSWSSKY